VSQHTPAEAPPVKTWRRKDELEPFEVERWAHAATTGSVGRKAVLQYLAARADERGSCFPGQRLIGEATEQGERTVRRHLADMTANGLLCHRSRSREDGRGRSSDRYFLHVNGECAREDCPLLTTDDLPANLAGRTATNRPTEDDQPATGGRRGNSQSLNSQFSLVRDITDASGISFEAFWESYPRRHGKRVDKPKAENAWKRLSRGERDAAMTGVKHYAQACEGGVTLAKDAHRWLRDRCWVDWQEPAETETTRRPSDVPADAVCIDGTWVY
jgi:hypothetical protein